MTPKAKINSKAMSREEMLEALLEATALLHGAESEQDALHQSFQLVATLLAAQGIYLYKPSSVSAGKGKKKAVCTGLQRIDGKWAELSAHNGSVSLPESATAEMNEECFCALGSGFKAPFASEGLELYGIQAGTAFFLLGFSEALETADTLGFLRPFVRSLKGYVKREAAECKVASQRNYLRMVIDNIPGYVYAKDEEGRFVLANKSVAEAYGVPVQALIGKGDRDFHHNNEEVDRYLEEDREVIQKGRTLSLPNDHITRPDGSTVLLSTVKMPVPGVNGNGVNVLGISLDVTAWKEAEQRDLESRRRYKDFVHHTNEGIYLIEMHPPIPTELPVDDKVDAFYRRGIFTECNQALADMYGTQTPEDLQGTLIYDVHKLGDFAQNRSVVKAFMEDGYRINNMETLEKTPDGREAWFMNHAIGIVEDGCLTAIWGGQIDITDRKEMENSLRRKQQLLHFVLEGAAAATWFWYVPENQVEVSASFSSLFGYRKEEWPRCVEEFNRLVHPEDIKGFLTSAKNHLRGKWNKENYEYEMRIRNKEGEYRWILNRGRAVAWDEDGYPIRGSGLYVDIHERKEMELRLREKREHLEVASEGANVVFWDWRMQEGRSAFKSNILSRLGYEQEGLDVPYQEWESIVHEEDLELFRKLTEERVFQQRQGFATELRLRHADGHYLWFYDFCRLYQHGGQEFLAGLLVNIDSRKRSEIALKESEERLKIAIEGNTLGIWDWDIQHEKVRNSIPMMQYLGHDDAPEETSYDAWLSLLHPEDRERLKESVCEQMSAGDTFELEYRVRAASGAYCWVYDKGKVTHRDTNGQATYAIGVSIDVSDRKRIELELRQSQERVEMIVDAAKLGLWEWEPQTDACYYNDYWGQMLGYEPDEIEPHKSAFERLAHPEDAKKVEHILMNELEEPHNEFSTEIRMRSKSGEWRWIQDQGKVVERNESGSPTCIVGIHMDISERKQAERALRESESLFRGLFEDSPMAILFCDAEGKIIEANGRAVNLLKYKHADELIKLDIDKLSATGSLVDSLLRSEIPDLTKAAQLERRLVCRDGDRIWANLQFSILYDADGKPERIICSIEDISARRDAQEALIRSKQLQQAILEALPDLKFLVNLEGKFLYYYGSDGGQEDLLMIPEEFLGKKVDEVLPDYLAKALRSNIEKAIASSKVQSFEYPHVLNGVLRHYEARLSAVNDHEAIVVVRDITEMKQMQSNLRKKVEELDRNNEMLTRYIDSNTQLENFAHTVSHDLREPVRTMNSFSQLLKRNYANALDEDAHSYLDFIGESAKHMNKLIEDLLKFARFTNSEHHGFEEVDLSKLFDTVQTSLRGLINDKEASIVIKTPLPTLMGNPTKLGQLFQNLVSNAIKFSPQEQKPVVEISCKKKGDMWHFAISDNGIGISPEDHQKIFQLFRRLHSKKHFPGSGIGLALCKRVVEQHGGAIRVESEVGEGATFHFTVHENY